MPWTAIVNPVAGRGRTQKLLPELERAASAAGITLHVSPEPGAPTKLALAAVDEGHDLVACGGDGLVTEVAGVAADTGRRLAIVPTGAGNDFARVLGYDHKNPIRAFDAIANGHDRVVDLGRVNGRWYTCVTASGFDAEANRWANTVRRLSGTTLYVAAVLRTLAVYKPHQFRVTVDGNAFETTAWLVAVGNGPAYAGGMRVTPDGAARRRPARRHDRRCDDAAGVPLELPQGLQGQPRRQPEGHHAARRRAWSSSRSTRRSRWRSTPTASESDRCRERWKPSATR